MQASYEPQSSSGWRRAPASPPSGSSATLVSGCSLRLAARTCSPLDRLCTRTAPLWDAEYRNSSPAGPLAPAAAAATAQPFTGSLPAASVRTRCRRSRRPGPYQPSRSVPC